MRASSLPPPFFPPPLVTEAEAVRAYGEDGVQTYSTQFTPMYHAVTERKVPSRMKLVCRKDDEKVLGLHIMGQVCWKITFNPLRPECKTSNNNTSNL